MFRRWFKKVKNADSAGPTNSSSSHIPIKEEWLALKRKWEKSRLEHSQRLLIQEEAASMQKVKGTLEEALSLLDDACVESEGLFKVKLHQIWSDLDELVKTYMGE
ncbi:hypothetical protein [Paenibacillus macerans]|uniref:hypothetical protein n=1 Tax=Paenibacillus macerans TaxID=44252 RepID=UPI0022E23ACC|nr:hypothetical protein [Paenibacillus macerans]